MIISKTSSRRTPGLRGLALCTLLAVAAVPGWRASASDARTPVLGGPVTASGAPPDVTGGQFHLGRLTCVVCAGTLIGVGTGTAIGLFAVAVAWPEFGFWCAVKCYYEFR